MEEIRPLVEGIEPPAGVGFRVPFDSHLDQVDTGASEKD